MGDDVGIAALDALPDQVDVLLADRLGRIHPGLEVLLEHLLELVGIVGESGRMGDHPYAHRRRHGTAGLRGSLLGRGLPQRRQLRGDETLRDAGVDDRLRQRLVDREAGVLEDVVEGIVQVELPRGRPENREVLGNVQLLV